MIAFTTHSLSYPSLRECHILQWGITFALSVRKDCNVMHWRRKWQPTPLFLPGESQGQSSLVGCRLWGRTESDTTDVTQQQQYGLNAEDSMVSRNTMDPALNHDTYLTSGETVYDGSVMCVLVTQSYPTLCNVMDCSLAGSPVHGILQARILEWVAIFFSRRSSRRRD